MAQDAVYADLLDSLSPLSAAGIDPDEARLDRAGTMAKLGLGQQQQPSWLQAQNDAPPQPGTSQNGNALPPGLKSRTPAAAVPGGVAPSGTEDMATVNVYPPSDLAGRNAATIGLGQDDYARASQDVQNEAAQPDLATLTEPLERQRVSAQRRQVELENPYDPKTGKLLDEYKPSFGQRMMRGVEGFARGGVLGAVNPGMTGGQAYGAPNKLLGIDQRQAAGQVAGADQQLTQAAANWKAQNDRLKQVASERRALATTLKDVTGASIAQQEIPMKQQDSDSKSSEADTAAKEAYNRSPEAKVATTQAEFAEAQRQADKLGIKGQNRTLFLANGKIPDPRQATEDEIATHQATQIFAHENGHPPQTLEEFNEVRRAAKGADKQLGQNGQPVATVADKNRASLAHVADDNLRQIEEIVNRRPDIFGKIGGRISNAQQLVGSDDPDLQVLGNAAHNFAMANAGIHGSRSFENVKAAEEELLNNLKSGPNGIRGAIRSNRENLQTIIDRVEGGGKSSSNTNSGPQIKVGDKVNLKNGTTVTVKAVHPDGSFE